MEALLNAFRSLGPGRILALFIGLAAIIAISSMVISRAQNPGLALLYGGLSAQEASRISDYLGTQNIAYETRGEGSVYVPADKVGQLRLQVAGQGLVGGSTSGYELFDNQSSFGTTNFVSNLNAKRALEGELARTIGTIPAVAGARVHIVMPKQNLFSRETIIPSAAIALNLGPRTLTEEQVRSIAQLVAAGVPNLSPENITIIDQRSTMLYNGKEQTVSGANANKFRRSVESSYETSLTSMLERIVGVGKVAVRVTADLNLDKVAEQSEIYDPTQQVVRSEQTTESSSNSGSGSGGVTGVAGNTPDGTQAGTSGGSNSAENRTETTTNYEITKTMRTLNKEGGEVKKLSVAVLVAGKAVAPAPAAAPAEGADAPAAATPAAPTYTALTEAEKTQLRTLVATAIGFNEARGDKVEIIDMPFTEAPEAPAVEASLVSTAQLLSLAQYALMAIALIVVALMVVRPALTTLNAALTSGSGSISSALAGGGGGGGVEMGVTAESDGPMIDMRSVQGRVKESAVKKVNDIVDQYPEESLSVVRGWMNQDGSKAGS
jgi:flagellar M-ring protein FliF